MVWQSNRSWDFCVKKISVGFVLKKGLSVLSKCLEFSSFQQKNKDSFLDSIISNQAFLFAMSLWMLDFWPFFKQAEFHCQIIFWKVNLSFYGTFSLQSQLCTLIHEYLHKKLPFFQKKSSSLCRIRHFCIIMEKELSIL